MFSWRSRKTPALGMNTTDKRPPIARNVVARPAAQPAMLAYGASRSTMSMTIPRPVARVDTTTNTIIPVSVPPVRLPPNLPQPMGDLAQVYYINLTRCFERRTYMQNLFAHPRYQDVRVERIGGCDGEREPIEQLLGFRDVLPNSKMTRSEYGCTISHFRAIHAFSQTDVSYALIVEDDVSDEYVPYWTQTLQEQIEGAPDDWEVLQLSYIQWGYIPQEPYERTEMSKNLCGTAAYVIRNAAAKRLIAYLCPAVGVGGPTYTIGPEYPLFHYADRFLYLFFVTYCLRTPPFTYRDANDSLIHPEHMDLHARSKKEIWSKTYAVPLFVP